MSTLTKLMLAFAAVVSIGLAQGAVTFTRLDRLGDNVNALATGPLAAVDSARSALQDFREAELFLDDDLDMVELRSSSRALVKFDRHADALDLDLKRLGATASDAYLADKARFIQKAAAQWRDQARQLIKPTNPLTIPAPFALVRSQATIKANLDEFVKRSLADARTIRDSVTRSIADGKTITLGLIVFGLMAGTGLAIVSSLSVTQPIKRLEMAMGRLTNGHLDIVVSDKGRPDELGRMAVALEVLRAKLVDMHRWEQVEREGAQRAETERHKTRLAVAERFNAEVAGVIERVLDTSTIIQDAAASMESVGQETRRRIDVVVENAATAIADLRKVAAETDIIATSANEISKLSSRSHAVVSQAVTKAIASDAVITSLIRATNQIDKIVGFIADIAKKTNMLALNATIEAARAGAAGYGFAVVAGEVKALSDETAKATHSITTQVEYAHQAAEEAAATLKEIQATVRMIDATVADVALAAGNQQDAVRAIAEVNHQVSINANTVASALQSLIASFSEVESASSNIRSKILILNETSQDLNHGTKGFLRKIVA